MAAMNRYAWLGDVWVDCAENRFDVGIREVILSERGKEADASEFWAAVRTGDAIRMETSATGTTEKSAPKTKIPNSRPRPIIRPVRNPKHLAWEPVSRPLFVEVESSDGQAETSVVRAGEAFAIVRKGWERWPLGIVSDHFKVNVNHVTTDRDIRAGAELQVRPTSAIMSAHGYHVAQSYELTNLKPEVLEDGTLISSRLVVAHSYSGHEAYRACMVVYVGQQALGTVVSSTAMHVASQPQRWASDIEAMKEKSIIAQMLLADLFKAARECKLTEKDLEAFVKANKKAGFTARSVKKAQNLLEAVTNWHEGTVRRDRMTWNIWARRLNDDGIFAMLRWLGVDAVKKIGVELDLCLGGRRYGREFTDARRKELAPVGKEEK